MTLAGASVLALLVWTLLAYLLLPLPFQEPLFTWLRRQWLVEGIAACAFLGWAAAWWVRRRSGLVRPAWLAPWALWLAWAALGALLSIDRGLTYRQWLAFSSYGLLALVTQQVAAASPRGPRIWAKLLAGLGIVAALEGWLQYAVTFEQTMPVLERLEATGGLDLSGWGGGVVRDFLQRKRIFSMFGWPNLYAGFLLLVAPVAAGLSAGAARPISRLVWGAAAGAMLVSLVLTLSMGGWFAAVMTGCVWWALRGGGGRSAAGPGRRRPVPRLLLAGIGVCAALLVGGLVVAKRARPFILHSVSSRLVYLQGAVRVITQRPLTGTGLGTYGVAYHAVKPREGFEGQHTAQHAHNTLLEVTAELGLVGLGVFLWMLWPIGRLVGWAVGRADPPPPRLARGLGLGVLAFFVHGLLEQSFVEANTAPFWWFALGVLAAVRGQAAPDDRPAPDRTAWAPGLIAGAGVLILVRLGAADAWAARAGTLALAGRHEASLEALARAQSWDPATGRYAVERGERLLRGAGSAPLGRRELEAAREQFERAVAASPWMGHAWRRLGEVCWLLGDADRALAASREAVQRDPNSRQALAQWAKRRYALGDLPGGLEAARRLQVLEPADPEGWFVEALVFGRTGPAAEALRAYQTVVHRFPDHYPAWFNLGELLRRQGETAAAAAAYGRFLRLAPPGDASARAVAERFLGAAQ
jgi:tetratricopeptide (TPR) repeat protein